jgi:LPS export ABC transporter protein LptC
MRTLMALVGVAVLTSACRDIKQPPVVAGASAADSADQVFIGMRTVLTTKGVNRADLTADTAYVLEDQTRFDLRITHVVFTTETGAPQGTMDAKRGMYSTRTQILEGWGDVVVRLVDGKMLRSPHVIYNQMAHTITSDTNYTIARGADTQSGIGFTSNETFTQFNCLRACTGKTSLLLPER